MTLRRIRWEEVQAGSGTRISSEFSGQLNMVFWLFSSFLLDSICRHGSIERSLPLHVRRQ